MDPNPLHSQLGGKMVKINEDSMNELILDDPFTKEGIEYIDKQLLLYNPEKAKKCLQRIKDQMKRSMYRGEKAYKFYFNEDPYLNKILPELCSLVDRNELLKYEITYNCNKTMNPSTCHCTGKSTICMGFILIYRVDEKK